MNVTKDIRYVGVNDHQIDLFEGQYRVPLGMAYNSYLILDRKIAVMDTVDQKFGRQWLTNLAAELCGREPDYLVVQHMEPDHSANIALFMETYPKATLVSSAKAFPMMKNFFGTEFEERRIVVKEGDVLELGEHTLAFVQAPMVHWPEVIMTYDTKVQKAVGTSSRRLNWMIALSCPISSTCSQYSISTSTGVYSLLCSIVINYENPRQHLRIIPVDIKAIN